MIDQAQVGERKEGRNTFLQVISKKDIKATEGGKEVNASSNWPRVEPWGRPLRQWSSAKRMPPIGAFS